MNEIVDCIVVGAGLAGISAALTLQANGNTFRLLTEKGLSEKIEKAEIIRNYPGLSAISGKDFSVALRTQLAEAGVEVTPFCASQIYPMTDKFIVVSQEGQTIEGKSVILALGVQAIKSIEGEESFLGRGVSYCATCDGFLYKDKEIAVLCASKKYEEEVLHLASFAKKVTLIPLYKGCAIDLANVEILSAMPKAVTGEKRVEKLLFAKPIQEGKREIAIDGLFVLKDGVSPTMLLPDLAVNEGHIVVDNKMQTSCKGVFAAGDCTGRPYQYAKAVGEGNVAAFSVKEYCQK